MKCAITEENQRLIRQVVAATLHLNVNEGTPFNLKEIVLDMYNDFLEEDDHATAIDIARLTPLFIDQMISQNNKGLKNPLKDLGLDRDEIDNLINLAEAEDGITAIENYLGLNQSVAGNLKDLNTSSTKKKKAPKKKAKKKAEPMVEGTPSVAQLPLGFQGSTIPVSRNEDKSFEAHKPTTMSDTDQEAISMDPKDPDYNVINEDPATKLYFKVKRAVIAALTNAGFNPENVNFQKRGPVQLRAQLLSHIPEDQLRESDKDQAEDYYGTKIALVLTDKYGSPLRFDNTGTIDDGGSMIYYNFNVTEMSPEDKNKAIASLAALKNSSFAEAQTIIEGELQTVKDIETYLRAEPTPEKTTGDGAIASNEQREVRMDINGGSLGYSPFDFTKKTPLNTITMGTPFKVKITTSSDELPGIPAGVPYYMDNNLHGNPIVIQEAAVKDTPYGTYIADLLTNEVQDEYGNVISNKAKLNILETYLETRDNQLKYKPASGDLMINGITYKTDIENAEAARTALKNYLNKLAPVRKINKNQIGPRKVVKTEEEMEFNTVLETKDGSGKSTYRIVEYVRLDTKKDLVEGNALFDNLAGMTPVSEGVVRMETEHIPYSDYIKATGYINHTLNGAGEVVRLNAYMTFEVNSEEGDKLGLKAEQDSITAEVQDTKLDVEDSTEDYNSDDPGDIMDDFYEDPDLIYKSFDTKKTEKKATKAQNTAAKKWFEDSPLSDNISFKIASKMVNQRTPNGVASFETAGITLYKGATFSDLYHEAWHAFTQTYLTPEQKKALYSEVSNKEGSFTDHNGNRVSFAKASNEQLEEYLAENFREYMLSGGKAQKGAPVRNGIFSKILAFLKALFGNSTYTSVIANGRADAKINALYNKLRVGNLTEYTYSAENVEFGRLNKGIQIFNEASDVKKNLNYGDSMKIVSLVDSLISEFTDGLNSKPSEKQLLELAQLEGQVKRGELEGKALIKAKSRIKGLTLKGTYKFTSTIFNTPKSTKAVYKHVLARIGVLHNNMTKELESLVAERVKGFQGYSSKHTASELMADMRKDATSAIIETKDTTEVVPLDNEASNKIMLSRTTTGELTADTKEFITKANKKNITFILGDNIERDTPLANYLDSIGADYKIYHAGETAKIEKTKKEATEYTNKAKASELKKSIRILYFAIEHFGDLNNPSENKFDDSKSIKGVIAFHAQKSKYMIQEAVDLFFEEDNMSETDSYVKGLRGHDRAGNESSHLELASREVVYLLRGLFETNEDGSAVEDTFGARKLLKFTETWNRLARALQNLPTIEAMHQAIKDEAEDFAPFKQLLNKLGPVDTLSTSETHLWSKFWQTFNLTRVPLMEMTVEKVEVKQANGTTTTEYISKIGEASGDFRKVDQRWQSDFNNPEGGKYMLQDDEGMHLNLDQILKDFPARTLENNLFEFYNAIGFNLSDKTQIREALAEDGALLTSARFYRMRLDLFQDRKQKVAQINDLNRDLKSKTNIEYKNTYLNPKGNGQAYKKLLNLEARYSDQHNNFMASNAEGNTQFEHSLNNTLTMTVNAINFVQDSYDDEGNLTTAYQQLMNMPHMKHLDINRNPFAKASVWLNSLFILDNPEHFGEKRTVRGEPVKLNLTNLSGVRMSENGNDIGLGVASAKADEVSKLIMDFHLNVEENIPEFMRHADKGTSFSAALSEVFVNGKMSKYGRYIDNNLFMDDSPYPVYLDQAMKILIPHIGAELSRMNTMKEMAKEVKKGTAAPFDFTYMKEGQNFVTFDRVLSTTTKNLLKKVKDAGNLAEVVKSDVNLRQRLQADVAAYFQKQYVEVNEVFENNNIDFNTGISTSLKTKLNEELDTSMRNKSLSHKKEALLKSYVYNSWIHNIESLSIIYGDLAQYNHHKEGFHKRNASAGSTGRIHRTDKAMNNYLNQQGMGYAKSQGIHEKQANGRMDTAIVQDSVLDSAYYKEYEKAMTKAGSAVKYLGMEEGDAQGFITLDSYRRLKMAQGAWITEMEDVYKKVINNERINPEDVTTFFPSMKAQYFGPLDTKGLPITALHKFNLYPMIPTVIKGTNLEKLHTKMMNEGVDYMVFQSGSKVGTLTKDESGPDEIYSKNKTLTEVPFTPNGIFLEYLKDQLEIAPKYKNQVIFSTQLRKLIEDGLMKNGIPDDFMTKSKHQARKNGWAKFKTEEAKEKASPFYALVKKYEGHIAQLTRIKKEKLLADINWTSSVVNGVEKLDGKLEDLLTFVKKELTRQDLGDHEIDFLDVNSKGGIKTDLSLSLSADKIERLLNALVTKRLIKQKVNGEGLIQVSGALFENISAHPEGRNYTNPTDQELKEHGSNDLPTYHAGKDGKTVAMKVKIALQGEFMKLLQYTDLAGNKIDTIERLNELLKDEAWLNHGNNRKMVTMVGVRIPVQGLNSLEFMEVYQFLPVEAGNIIVPPAEIVAKSGSDFDVDKLTVMMPNLRKTYNRANLDNAFLRDLQSYNPELDFSRDNLNLLFDAVRSDEAVYTLTEEDHKVLDVIESYATVDIEYLEGDSEKGVQNALINDIKAILELEHNFGNLVRPNDTDILLPIADDLAMDVMDYNPYDVEVEGKEKKEISPTRALEIRYNLYKHASNNIGKQTLGLGAVDNTYNVMLNRVGAYMNPSAGMTTAEYNKIKDSKKWEDKMKAQNYHPQKLFLPHHTVKVGTEEGISLSHLEDANGEHKIADVINQMLNGWLDIAADAWIFNIQGNKQIAPTLLFMIQAGVPVKDAIYMASTPMVRRYVKEQQLAKSTFAEPLGKAPEHPNFFQSKAREVMLGDTEFGFNKDFTVKLTKEGKPWKPRPDTYINEIAKADLHKGSEHFNKDGHFDTAALRGVIKKGGDANRAGETHKYSELEKAAFIHFLEIENMAKAVRDLKLRMNVDTNKSKTLFEAQDKMMMIEELP